MLAETFLTAWRRLEDVPHDELPWLLGVARRHIANRRRSAHRVNAVTEKLAATIPLPASHPSPALEGPLDNALVRSIRNLPEKEREAFMLVAWDGLDPTQAALVAGCSATTFRVRLHRARSRLKRELAHLETEIGSIHISTGHMEEAR